MTEVNDEIIIPADKIIFRYSRSGGPGGQNVNKVNTRVTLFFDVPTCRKFSDEQKRRILKKLATRADKQGVIRVVCQRYRTQKANQRVAVERLNELLADALKNRPIRRITKPPQWAKQKRLERKKHRSSLKKQRAEKNFEL